jgi:hypothetical protein
MIEMGKTYRTHGNREARIYAISDHKTYPVHGAVLSDDGWSVQSWTLDGKFGSIGVHIHDLCEISPHSLVSCDCNVGMKCPQGKRGIEERCKIWKEAPGTKAEVKPRHKRTVWINVYPDHAAIHPHRQSADYNNVCRLACICVDLDFEEGEGL